MSSDERENDSVVDRCSEIIQKYCTTEFLPQSAQREILTFITELYQIGKLNEVNSDSIEMFIQTQCESIKTMKEFPFEIFEICFTFYASKEMKRTLYNDKQMSIIIKSLGKFCNENLFQNDENSPALHRLFPILRLCSRMVERCALTETMLGILIEIAQTSYFNEASSPPLQSAACSLLSAIFKRYTDERNEILSTCFYTVEKAKKISTKNLFFSKKGKTQISAFTVLLLELMQSTYVYGLSSEESEIEVTVDILDRLSKLPPKFLDQFSKDLFNCLTHPFYPVAIKILPRYLNFLYSHVVKKTKLSRIAIRTFCSGLAAINEIIKQINTEEEIKVSEELRRNIIAEQDFTKLTVNKEFPATEKERIAAEMLILAFIKNSFRMLNTADTATQTHIYMWGMRKLDQDESEFLGSWSAGAIPDLDLLDIKFDQIEKLHIALSSKQPIFGNTQEIITRLLGGLKNRSSTIRGMVMDGFSVIVEQNTEYLFHPELVSLLQPAFVDPCATVRDAALKIVSTYIQQHEQIKSPYFPQIINCLHDSSTSIVRRALVSLATLAQTASDKELMDLCKILVTKLDDEAKEVKKSAKLLLMQSFFEYSSTPDELFLEVTSVLRETPEWWSAFVKESYIKYQEKMKCVINSVLNRTCEEPNAFNATLLYDFAHVLPSACAKDHEKLISALFLAQDDATIAVIAQTITLLIPYIAFPVITSFSLLMNQLEELVNSKGSGVVRPVIELLVSISNNILPDNTSLQDLQLAYAEVLMKCFNQRGPATKEDEGKVIRSIFITGILIRECGWESKQSSLNKVASVLARFYMWNSPEVKNRVLEAFIDICVKDPNQIKVGKNLVSHAFSKGDPISALNFIKSLIEEEYKADDTTSMDDVKTNSAPSLVSDNLKNIKSCCKNKNVNVRNSALSLISVAIKHGIINTHEVLPCVIGMLSSKTEQKLAADTIKTLTISSENALKTRLSEGLEFGFNLCRNFPEDTNMVGMAELYKLLSPQNRRTMIATIVNQAVNAIDGTNLTKTIDCYSLKCLMEISCSLEFENQWEPAYFISLLHSSMKKRALNDTIIKDAGDAIEVLLGRKKGNKEVDTRPWYCTILVLRAMHWIRRRFQVNMKKIYSDVPIKEEKKDVKVALIDKPSISSLPEPSECATEITDAMLDLYAALSSITRHERATQSKYNVHEDENEENEKKKE